MSKDTYLVKKFYEEPTTSFYAKLRQRQTYEERHTNRKKDR